VIGYDDALRILLAQALPLGADAIEASAARGRVLASALRSAERLPPFDNSAMDGFALRCDAEADGLAAGAEFDVTGASAAGDGIAAARTGAWEVMTGARMPPHYDAVVPVEQVSVLSRTGDRAARIRLDAAVARGQHVRRAGTDIELQDVIAEAGTLFDAALGMVCAAVGIARVDVRRRPRVALVNTGRELVDDARRALGEGEIRNSNGPFLAARLHDAGAEVLGLRTVADDADAFLAAIDSMPGADLVVSTGAVSMGRFDFVPDALARRGAITLFHKVAIRPGKPILAARLPSGALFFGLPGNPASTAVGLRFFVEPVLRAMLGMAPERALRLPLRAPHRKRVPLRMHLKARVVADAHGMLGVELLGGQESFRIRPLLDANAWAVVPAEAETLDAGAPVEVVGLGHLQPLAVHA
jgi:molybdopterin molybdotransferase